MLIYEMLLYGVCIHRDGQGSLSPAFRFRAMTYNGPKKETLTVFSSNDYLKPQRCEI